MGRLTDPDPDPWAGDMDAQAPAAFAAWSAIKSGAWDRHLLTLRAAINHRMIVAADPAERLTDEPVPYWPAAGAEP